MSENKKKSNQVLSEKLGDAVGLFLTEGKIDRDTIEQSPLELIQQMGYELSDDQKAQLKGVTMEDLLGEAYLEFGQIDKRFLKARKEFLSGSDKALSPALVGVVIALGIAAVVIVAGSPKKRNFDDPNESEKL